MKVKEIVVTVSRLVKAAEYENITFSVSETIELDKGDEPEKIRKEKIKELTDFIESREKAYKKSLKKSKQ